MITILAIAAHPDDETMLAGETLAMYAELATALCYGLLYTHPTNMCSLPHQIPLYYCKDAMHSV